MRILGKIAFVWFALVFAGVFLIFYPFFLIFLSHQSLYPVANFLRKVWAWLIMLLCVCVPFYVREGKKVNGPCVFVCNHTSYLDIVALGLIFPLKVSFMGKMELGKIPLFGIFFRTVDIGVNRKSIRDSHRAFLIASEKIRHGYSIGIFPEGTIWEHTPRLKPFKNGAFRLAIENKIPIVPVTFYNNFRILPDEKYEYYPYILKFKIHRAIPTAHLNTDDSDRLKDEIYALIENELKSKKIIT